MKRLHEAISECHVCGAAADEQCRNLRTGKPTKNDHAGGRYLTLNTHRFGELAWCEECQEWQLTEHCHD